MAWTPASSRARRFHSPESSPNHSNIHSWVPSGLVTKPSSDITILRMTFRSGMSTETRPLARTHRPAEEVRIGRRAAKPRARQERSGSSCPWTTAESARPPTLGRLRRAGGRRPAAEASLHLGKPDRVDVALVQRAQLANQHSHPVEMVLTHRALGDVLVEARAIGRTQRPFQVVGDEVDEVLAGHLWLCSSP